MKSFRFVAATGFLLALAIVSVNTNLAQAESTKVAVDIDQAAFAKSFAHTRESSLPRLELLISNLAPVDYAPRSFVQGVGKFGSALHFGANMVVGPVLGSSSTALQSSLVLGLGVTQMSRTGTVNLSGIANDDTQRTLLMPVMIGLKTQIHSLQWGHLATELQVWAEPSLAISNRSTFSEPATDYGISFGAGLHWAYQVWNSSLRPEIVVGPEISGGWLGGQSVSCLGVTAGLRLVP